MSKKYFLISAFLLPFIQSAHADLFLVGGQTKAPAFTVPEGMVKIVDHAYDSIIEVGDGQAKLNRDNIGVDIDFVTALTLLTPDDWKVYIDPSLIVDEHFTWLGDMTWIQELRRIGTALNIQFVVNWDQKVVLARQGSDLIAKMEPAQETRSKDWKPTSNVTNEVQSTLPTFVLDEGNVNEGELIFRHEEEGFSVVEE